MSFSAADATSSDERLSALVEALCGSPVRSLALCGGGGNNRVYRVQTDRGPYALKCYASAETDQRDRLGHEFDGLQFLKACGVGATLPAAVAVDRASRCALFEWVDGAPVGQTHTAADVGAVLELMRTMHAARADARAAHIPEATEAVLRPADLIAQLERRLGRLAEVAPSEPELDAFLRDELRSELDRRLGALSGWAHEATLDPARRTLSPSDFGFHNALRRPDGTLTFIDFEYFGWDDPVKLVADFLWHPAMALRKEERLHFWQGATDLYGDDPDFGRRMAAYHPLFGIRWCLIVLNEFLPALWARRAFSGKGRDLAAAKREQLLKARTMLNTVRSYEERPFA